MRLQRAIVVHHRMLRKGGDHRACSNGRLHVNPQNIVQPKRYEVGNPFAGGRGIVQAPSPRGRGGSSTLTKWQSENWGLPQNGGAKPPEPKKFP